MTTVRRVLRVEMGGNHRRSEADHRVWRLGLFRRYSRRRDILRKEKIIKSKDRLDRDSPTHPRRGAVNPATAVGRRSRRHEKRRSTSISL